MLIFVPAKNNQQNTPPNLICHTPLSTITHTKLYTFEKDKNKLALAGKTIDAAGVDNYVEVVSGDLLEHLNDYRGVSFCFLDTSKDIYSDCYEIVIANMVSGGILIADNAISHQSELQNMLAYVQSDSRVDATIAPIGKGLLICRKNSDRDPYRSS